MLKISVIVTTYNRPAALELVLRALAAQTDLKSVDKPSDFEVIIADDGSTDVTAESLKQLATDLPYQMRHIWQEDQGFRAARARNRAIAAAKGEYVIFLDGDCVPQTDFIAKHRQLAEVGIFVVGNRILLSKRFTNQILNQVPSQTQMWCWPIRQWLLPYLRRDINRFLPLLRLPNSVLRRHDKQTWQGAKTCNLGIWRSDLLKINGLDERFQGWGHEDAELVVRLLRSGIRRKTGRFAVPVLHLWHPEQDRAQEGDNRQRLEQRLKSSLTWAEQGVDQYK
jgi:glycosyltransferase involved in cell wall biosynthesis